MLKTDIEKGNLKGKNHTGQDEQTEVDITPIPLPAIAETPQTKSGCQCLKKI